MELGRRGLAMELIRWQLTMEFTTIVRAGFYSTYYLNI